MRKITLILATMLILLTGCSNKLKTYKAIDYNEFNDMINNKESFILYIGAKSCSHCASYTLTLNRVIKQHQVVVYYLDMESLTEEQHKEFIKEFNYSGTPTTVFVTDGVEKSVYNRIEGEQSYDKIVEKFKKNNYIK